MIDLSCWNQCFVKNEYYNKYLQLICSSVDNIKTKITQRHHIVPQCFFIYCDKVVDNSSANIVNLSLSNHLLAHYYLANCTTGKFKYAMQSSLRYLTKGFDYADIIQLIPQWEEEYVKYNQAISIKMKGHPVSQHVRDAVSRSRKGVPPHNKGKPMSDEQKIHLSLMKKGVKRQPHSEETKHKISVANKGRVVLESTKEKLRRANTGKSISNNAKAKIGAKTSRMRWYTNGTKTIYINESVTPPEGYRPGRTMKERIISEEEHMRRSLASKERERQKKLSNKGDN